MEPPDQPTVERARARPKDTVPDVTRAPDAAGTASHWRASDLRGAGRLAVDATLALASLVENLHHNILRLPAPIGAASQRPTRGITGLVYRSIRGVTRVVGGSLDAVLGQLEALLAPATTVPTRERESVLAALNGVLGDRLAADANPLAISMRLWHDGAPLGADGTALGRAIEASGGRVLLLIHGLCMSPLQWRRTRDDGTRFDLGAALATAGGYCPVYLQYNSGLHISTNGRQLAELLERLPVPSATAMRELTIVGHSMGGLVARSAVHQAQALGLAWPHRLRAMVFLGTPHHGAPLERGGHWIERLLGASPYTAAFARLARLRSAGITDLRHGNLLDADWADADRFAHRGDTRATVALPRAVACCAVAGSLGRATGDLPEKLLGDGLVPVASALGRHRTASLRVAFDPDRQWVAHGVDHLALLASEAVLAQLRAWLITPSRRSSAPRRDTDAPLEPSAKRDREPPLDGSDPPRSRAGHGG